MPLPPLPRDTEQDELRKLWEKFGRDTGGCYRRDCRLCGKVFYSMRPETRYCSAECGKQSNKHRPKEPARCLHCGQEFMPRRVSTDYCSPDCWNDAIRWRRFEKVATETFGPEMTRKLIAWLNEQLRA